MGSVRGRKNIENRKSKTEKGAYRPSPAHMVRGAAKRDRHSDSQFAFSNFRFSFCATTQNRRPVPIDQARYYAGTSAADICCRAA
jgi:hypothetical protein